MILEDKHTLHQSEPWVVSHIVGEISRSCAHMDDSSRYAISQVAKGVEAFLDEEARSGVVGPGHIRSLTVRALVSAGRTEIARSLLLAGSGMVRASSCCVVDGGTVLSLDLQRLGTKENERLDLMLRKCLLSLLDSMACMWDESGGRGALGLRNVYPAAAGFLGKGTGRRKVDTMAREIRAVCGSKLGILKRQRAWRDCPYVIDMDWNVATSNGNTRGL